MAAASANTPPLVTTRAAVAADVPALGHLGALLVAMHYEFDPDRFISPRPGTERAYGDFLVTQIGRPEVIVLVAEQHNVVLGYTYAGLEGNDYMALRGPAGVVYDVVVDPTRRRQGIGRLLLDATLKALLERGAPRIVLSTAERNAVAQGLFGTMGFRRTMIEMTWDPPAKA